MILGRRNLKITNTEDTNETELWTWYQRRGPNNGRYLFSEKENVQLHMIFSNTGHLLGNLGKVGSNLFGVCRVIFDDNINNGDFQRVGASLAIEKALVK